MLEVIDKENTLEAETFWWGWFASVILPYIIITTIQQIYQSMFIHTAFGHVKCRSHHVSHHFIQCALEQKIYSIVAVSLIYQIDTVYSPNCTHFLANSSFILFNGSSESPKIVRTFKLFQGRRKPIYIDRLINMAASKALFRIERWCKAKSTSSL